MTSHTGSLKRPRSPQKPVSISAREVFVDPTGRRWRFVKACALLFPLALGVTVALSWRPVQQPPNISPANPELPPVQLPNRGKAPEIGVGPLVRLVLVANRGGVLCAVDPFTHQTLSALTPDDADAVGGKPYALQHFGYSSAAHKTIELSFDDGPDPTWTPRILDLLSTYKAPATFFVIGSAVVKYPDIVQREVREGFALGNHTLTHPDLAPGQVQQQFVSTDRILRAVTGVGTDLVRLPYDGMHGPVADADLNAVILDAERLRYLVSMPEFDTSDWKYGDPAIRPKTQIPLPTPDVIQQQSATPDTNTDNVTIVLHDGGGNRAATLAYLQRLLPWARANGYTFQSLPQVSPQVSAGTTQITPALWDRETLWMYAALWAWPTTLIALLFALAIVSVVVGSGLNVLLAVGRRAWPARRLVRPPGKATRPSVSIVLPAYNEAKVIRRTLEALSHSDYPNIREIIVVDDGSSDRTAEVVADMARASPRILLLRQENMGKAAALNRAFLQAASSVVVTLDADTLFTPTTVRHLVRPFIQEQCCARKANGTRGRARPLGAVAGVVKVGNRRNLLTRWQALEYLTMIGIDRSAQDVLRAIMVVPGACAAWDRAAVLQVGGYSGATLAEDCDLALELQQAGYGVRQEDRAICYTEAPETVRALAHQRYRWMYGNLQALWKHRRMIGNPRYGWLGLLTLPLSVVSVALPAVFLPFVYVMAVVTFEGQGLDLVLLYLGLFLAVQLVTAVVGVWLLHERPTHLLMVPLYRAIYEPLRAYILYKSALTILRGTRQGWKKLHRTGTVIAESSHATMADASDAVAGSA